MAVSGSKTRTTRVNAAVFVFPHTSVVISEAREGAIVAMTLFFKFMVARCLRASFQDYSAISLSWLTATSINVFPISFFYPAQSTRKVCLRVTSKECPQASLLELADWLKREERQNIMCRKNDLRDDG